MEENLNLHELQSILQASRKQEFQRQKFAAALKGVDLDDPNEGQEYSDFEDVKRRAEAKLRGISETQQEFEGIGIKVIQE